MGPAEIQARLESAEPSMEIAARGSMAVTTQGPAGVQVYELAGGGLPRPLGRARFQSSFPAGRCRFEGDRLYVAAGQGGTAVIDLAIPAEPQVLAPRDRKLEVIWR